MLYVDNGQFLTSAGAAAGLDLCLHMIRKDYGSAVAAHSARLSVMPLEREGGQAQFIVTDGRSYDGVRRYGVSIDFKMPSGKPNKDDPDLTAKFEGYASIPGLRGVNVELKNQEKPAQEVKEEKLPANPKGKSTTDELGEGANQESDRYVERSTLFLFTRSGGGIASRHAGHSSDTRETGLCSRAAGDTQYGTGSTGR